MLTIKNSKPVFYGLVLAATLSVGTARAWADDYDTSTTPLSAGNYCHLRFPAIRPETLGTKHPQLKSAAEGDLIDFYGPCDHDPVGQDEVEHQMEDQLVGGLRNFGAE